MTGKIHWTELLTDDIDAATTFLTDVIGWTAEKMPGMDGKYVILKNDEGPACGVMSIAGTHFEQAETGQVWLSYVSVADVGSAVDKALQAGGSVIQPPFDVPGIGRICLLSDPSDVPFGIITPAG